MAEENIKEQGSSKTKTCFVIMPISDHPDYAPGHFKRVYEYVLKPACKKAGYEAIRADDPAKTNDIVSDIIKKIIDSDMAICDMSSRNPNVFYELGLRHAFNLKTTLIKDKKSSRAFDIAGLRSVEYDESLRVDEVEKAIEAIAAAIEETEKMTSEEPNSTIQLLGLSTPAKKAEVKAMSGDNAAIMGEIRLLRYDVELMQRSYLRDKDRRTLKEESRLEEPAAIRVSPNGKPRSRVDLRTFSFSGNRDKED